jgi:RNA polymerase sigma-70 factor (ECF subfamily)
VSAEGAEAGKRDDRVLVRRMLAGEELAFEAFFDRYFPGLYRFALSRLRCDPTAAEEVAQSTLERAVTKLATYRGEAALFTWLCTFCRHEVSAYYRKHGRAAQQLELTEDAPEVRAALDLLALAADDPERLLQRKEVARLVQVTLDHLPPRYGDALEWKYIEGRSVAEIAERLQIGVKAAESVLTRAREAFREGWGAICREPLPWVGEGMDA